MKKKHLPLLLLAGSLFVSGLASCDLIHSSSIAPTSDNGGSSLPPSPSIPPSTSQPVVDEKVRVTLVYSNGEEDRVVELDAGEKIAVPETPVWEGHIFVGWSTNSSGYSAYDFETPVIADLTLTAIWHLEKVTITFNSNGGSKVNSLSGAPDSSLVMPSNPTRAGYIFSGWYLDMNFTQGFSQEVFPGDDLVLYAKWIVGSSSGSALLTWATGNNFYINYTPEVVEIGAELNFSIAVADMYDISKMEVRINGTRIYAKNGIFTFIVEGDSTITVSGIIDKTYKVTFRSNTGEADEETYETIVGYGKTVDVHPFERPGYNLIGFFTDPEGTIGFNFNNYILADTTLYAKWELATYKISYTNTYNSYNPNDHHTYNYFSPEISLLQLYNVPAGLEFAGWSLNGRIVTAIPTGSCGDIELEATWIRKTYTITYDTRAGNEEIGCTSGLYGDPIDFPQDPTKDGFFFVGWYTDPQCKILFDQTTYPAQDTILFAKWSLVPEGSSSLSFEGAEGVIINYDGQAPTGNYVKTGSTIRFSLAVKDSEGYSGSVYLQVNGLEVKPDSTGHYTLTINSDTKIKISGITQKTYTVTFVNNYQGGSTYAMRVPYNSSFLSIDVADPKRLGYEFTGWYYDSNLTSLISPSEKITADITVYAGWDIKVYTVHFALNGATYEHGSALTFTINDGIIILGQASREGYIFKGFYDSDNRRYLTIDPSNELYLRDITLVARFEIKTFTVVFMNETGSASYCRYLVNYNTPIKDFLEDSDFNLRGYTLNKEYMFTDISRPNSSKIDIYEQIVRDTVIYIRVNPQIVTYSFNNLSSDADPITLSTTDSGQTHIRDFGSTANLKLSRGLKANERLILRGSDGSITYLVLDEDNCFAITCDLVNEIEVYNPDQTGIAYTDEAGSGLLIGGISGGELFYVGDTLNFSFNQAIPGHLRLVQVGSGGDLIEIAVGANGDFQLVIAKNIVLKIVERVNITLSFSDESGAAEGFSIAAVDGGDLVRYIGEKVVFQLTGSLGDEYEVLITTDSYSSYKFVNAQNQFTVVVEAGMKISVVKVK